jgi:tetratricopeptide (TPR) repeat protein
LQARLSARIAANDIEAARETACEAVGIALKHEWPQLAAAVHMMMAAAYVERGNFHAAVASYREAERTAADKRLQLVALLGSAAVLFARASYAPAADVYMRAAVLADDVGDAERTLDCYRLASLCYATLGDRERAWTLGLDGLRIGSRMDPAQRAKSTLRSLSEQLISTFRGDSRERALRTQLAPLLEHG